VSRHLGWIGDESTTMSRLADVFLARADEWRKNKRYVEYYETKPLSDYNYQSIPGAPRAESPFRAAWPRLES
jgi:hypothetical protein